jgi:hypothetical protein
MALSYAQDVMPLFTDTDATHMDRLGVKLRDVDYMTDAGGGKVRNCPRTPAQFDDHAHARAVYATVAGENGCSKMPKGGPYWTDSDEGKKKLTTFKQWMTDGFNR